MSITIYPYSKGEAMKITYSRLPSTSAATMGVGSRIQITDLRNIELISDGTNWRPVGGRQTLYYRQGTLVSPLVTATGNGAAQTLVLPENLLIPAGLIPPHSKVYMESFVKRGGTAGAMTCVCALGINNTVVTDLSFIGNTIAATDGNEVRHFGAAQFGTSTTSFISTGSLLPNQTTTANQTLKNTQVNTAADMYVSIGCSNTSFISPDTMNLISYHVWIEG